MAEKTAGTLSQDVRKCARIAGKVVNYEGVGSGMEAPTRSAESSGKERGVNSADAVPKERRTEPERKQRLTGFNVLVNRRSGSKRKMSRLHGVVEDSDETEEAPICDIIDEPPALKKKKLGVVQNRTGGREGPSQNRTPSTSPLATAGSAVRKLQQEDRPPQKARPNSMFQSQEPATESIAVEKVIAERLTDPPTRRVTRRSAVIADLCNGAVTRKSPILRETELRQQKIESSSEESNSDSSDDSSDSEWDDSFQVDSRDMKSTKTFQTPEKAAKNGTSSKRSYRFLTRKKGKCGESDLGKKRAEQIVDTASLDFRKWKCCRRLECFAHVDLLYFRSQREKLLKASQSKRKQALTSMLQANGRFQFNLKTVCATFLELGFRFSRDLQSSVKGTPRAPAPQSTARGPKINPSSHQRDDVVSFLRDLADVTADEMPNSRERHLPYHQKSDVYALFTEIFKLRQVSHSNRKPATLAYFIRSWNTYVSHVKVRKIRPFAKCHTCEEARQALADARGDKEKCAPIMARRQAHLQVVTLERASYLSRATRAIQEPNKCWSIAIDGADQSRFGLPHFVVGTTKQTRGHAIKVKVVGLLQHASECSCFLYTMTGQFETGANHVIEVIHRWMLRKQRFGNFPDTLYVQTDNTTRENKNRYLLGYLECLVAWGVFKEIQISFLPVGHTHIDIDQRFSCTSRKLKTSNAHTMEELHEKLRKSMRPKPSTTALDHVANISGLFESSASLRSPPPFSRHRFFRFMRIAGRPKRGSGRFNTTCKVKMSCDDEWGRLFDAEPNWGFLLSAPDLRNTPDTVLRAPDDKEEVLKRIESEYSRINDENKRESLLDLLSRIYQNRRDKFHWNVTESPEMNGRHQYGNTSSSPVVSENDLRTYEPRTRVHYDINSFVAIKPEVITEACPFWIAQVLDNVRNIHGVVAGVKILWHEVEAGKNVYEGMYTVSQIKLRNGRWKDWSESVSTDAVFYNFPRLTRRGRLTSDDARRIEEEVEKRWLGGNHISDEQAGME